MRICLAISIAVHALIVLFLWLGPGARALNPAIAEPITVDLVSPQDADTKDEPGLAKDKQVTPEQAKADQAKADQAKSDKRASQLAQLAARKPDPPMMEPPTKSDTPKTDSDSSNTDSSNTDSGKVAAVGPDSMKPNAPKPNVSKPDDQRTAEQKDAEERAATAARLAELFDVPGQPLAGFSDDMKAGLTSEEAASFKAQVAKCWAPKGLPRMRDLHVVIRIGFTPDGRLWDRPQMFVITEGAQEASQALAAWAAKAVTDCQPYASLPADKYDEWKVLDMTFTPDGPFGIPTGGALN